LIAINIKDSPEKISDFIDGLGLTFPILIDENKSAAKDFAVYGVPTSFLIDKEGILTERFFGDLSEAETLELVKPLL
jgi:peroxiredoxin